MIIVLSSLFGCSEPAVPPRRLTRTDDEIHCEHNGDPETCYRAGSDPLASLNGQIIYLDYACDHDYRDACVKWIPLLAQHSPRQASTLAVGLCERTGEHCELALEIAKDPRIPEEKRDWVIESVRVKRAAMAHPQ